MRQKLCRCGAIREDSDQSVCQRCGAGRKHKTRNTTEHGYDGAWKRLSARLRAQMPLCEMCLKKDIVTPSTEVHHIVPIDEAPWLRLEVSNLMCVCGACHAEIHAKMAPGVG